MISSYTEPELTIGILDYCKPVESHLLLQSIKQHVKIPHKVVFCDNGSGEDYALEFLREGLIDQLIVNRESNGLGVGTRDLIAAITTPLFAYIQNDQLFAADLDEKFLSSVKYLIDNFVSETGLPIQSVSLAGYPCGQFIFSERAHIMKTSFYKSLEPLPLGGAGRFHNDPWREGAIQEIYKKNGWVHLAGPQIVQDNGVYALREMSEAGVWLHRTDIKSLFVIVPPTIKNPVYPKLNDEEFAEVLAGKWEDGRIPAAEIKDSFHCWDNTLLAKMEKDYVKDLRRRFAEKKRS